MNEQTLNIQEVKSQLSKVLEKVAAGTEVIIAKKGKPVARLSPVERGKPRVQFGMLKGKVKVADDFDDPLPNDVLSDFEGRECGS